jgi:hypothetical protein
MIHINESIREQSAEGNEQYEIKLTINTSSTLENKESSLNTRDGANIFREKEDNCTTLYIEFVNIKISKLVILKFPCNY